MKNKQIYEYAQKLNVFKDFNINLPVKIGFYLQKNIQTILTLYEEIEKARIGIGAKFGQLNKNKNGYDIPSEKMTEVNNELKDLFDLEQEVNIHKFKIEDFEGIELSYQELAAISFMIEE